MDQASSMSMSMAMSPTTSASAAAASSTMMSMGSGNTCKISMTWNWYTIGACFISSTWQIKSSGMFAGSCIGVICLVICLEFLRRAQREYEALIKRQDRKLAAAARSRVDQSPNSSNRETYDDNRPSNFKSPLINTEAAPQRQQQQPIVRPATITLFIRQVIRSLIHMLQFGLAYFIMLLAMYYNGYIIICIIIGAFLGAFIFSWDQLLDQTGRQNPDALEITGCCG